MFGWIPNVPAGHRKLQLKFTVNMSWSKLSRNTVNEIIKAETSCK